MTTVALLIGSGPESGYSAHRGYADALWAAGATPVPLAPPSQGTDVSAYVEAVLACDAVCLSGGGDIDPARYGASPEVELTAVDPFRDAAEIEAALAAVTLERPILGISRGMQVLAVALGGTLHQDLPAAGYPGHWDQARQFEATHPIVAAKGSLAARVLGGSSATNTIHHQAVKDPGPGLAVGATGTDGVIEAIERRRLLGVQWNPERLWARDERHLAPFRWLVSEASPAALR